MASKKGVLREPPAPESTPQRVAQSILIALEQRKVVPGQRLVETELALELGVGRNAVREAIQILAGRGIVDISRNRSPAIRRLLLNEALEVLEVAEELFGLVARLAARKFVPALHAAALREIASRLRHCQQTRERAPFSLLRRDFYRALLEISDNRELSRLFSTIQMQIVYAQFDSDELLDTRLQDYRRLCEAVLSADVRAAELEARGHVKHVRKIIEMIHAGAGRSS